ncbi:hypothetical protein [Niabella beijingensis]|uniref:hypothetical protein n=1 Tax=Niabella beijingensis TaxID=2872700 RepID=UPI001CBABEA9|nr:hypothetical protein [Niabella beijingensis]MBZ4187503.1 hypothetical protein [Niabella beijingensis]
MNLNTVRLEKKMRILQALCVFTSMLTCVILLVGFNTNNRKRFDEIDVERINIIEKSGKLRMTISNKERSPAPLHKGKEFGLAGSNRTGIIFFNEEESEVGGLTFEGKMNNTGKADAYGHFSFDQYNQNQVLYLTYSESDGKRSMGLNVDDWQESPPFSEWNKAYKKAAETMVGETRDKRLKELMEPMQGQPAFAKRVFVGRDKDRKATVMLADRSGKPRLRLSVDAGGEAKIEFLDKDGKVTYSLSGDKK